MQKVIQFSITHENDVYTASGINAPIVTDGATFEELQENIQEAVTLYVEEMESEKNSDFVRTPAIIANFELPTPSYA